MSILRFVAIPRDGRPAVEIELPSAAVDAIAAMVALYGRAGYVPPWIGYLAVEDAKVVGTCAFKEPPREGRVEIAYFTFPPHEGRGIATAMASELLRVASSADPGLTVTAQTLPVRNASNVLLRKLGFSFVGSVHTEDDGEVWEWSLPAPAARPSGYRG